MMCLNPHILEGISQSSTYHDFHLTTLWALKLSQWHPSVLHIDKLVCDLSIKGITAFSKAWD
jgi:hypothetical protein